MATSNDFIVKSGLVVKANTTISDSANLVTSNVIRAVAKPTLDINFARSGTLDPRISFNRASAATYFGKDGSLKYAANNQPRFDYDPITGQALGLLIEEQRTNLIPTSAQFTGWNNNSNLPIIDNNMVAPDGTLSAATTNSIGSTRYKSTTSAVTSGTTYTYSIYIKPLNPSIAVICYIDGGIGASNSFASSSVSVVPSTGSVALTGGIPAVSGTVVNSGNGWYRISVSFITLSTTTVACHIYPISANLTGWWGAQCEIGAQPSTYIPTQVSSVTRAADRCLLVPGLWYTPTVGTWFAEFQGGRESTQGFYGRVLSPIGASTILSTDNGSTFVVGSWIGGPNISATTSRDFWTTKGKAALTYNNNTLTRTISARGLTASGTYAISEAPGYIITTAMGIGQNAASASNMLNGHITRITYWPANFTAAQLSILTAN